MARLTIIVGIAGSGKSWLCDEIAKDRGIRGFHDATLIADDKMRAGYGRLSEIVARLLGKNEDCVMDEGHLADPTFRNLFKGFCFGFLPEVHVEWIFFEPDILKCINNVRYDMANGRGDRKRLEALYRQWEVYSLPRDGEFPGYSILPVHQCDQPHFNDKDRAIEWLKEQPEVKALLHGVHSDSSSSPHPDTVPSPDAGTAGPAE